MHMPEYYAELDKEVEEFESKIASCDSVDEIYEEMKKVQMRLYNSAFMLVALKRAESIGYADAYG